MRAIPNQALWPENRAREGELFFAQVMEEMLFDYSTESQRVPTHNSDTRSAEVLEIIDRIRNSEISAKNFLAPAQELVWSIKKDPIAREILGGRYEWLIQKLNDIQQNDHFENSVVYFRRNVQNKYFDTCCELLFSLINEGRKKSEIYRLTQSLCTSLINMGYSREGIYYHVRRCFFSSKSNISETTFNEFIKRYDGEIYEYDAYIKISITFSTIWEKLKTSNNLSTANLINDADKIPGITKDAKKYLNTNDGLILHLKVPGLDTNSSKSFAESILTYFEALTHEYQHNADISWDKNIFIKRDGKRWGILVNDSVSDVMKRRDVGYDQTVAGVSKGLRILADGRLPIESRSKITSASQAHSNALSAQRPETQLTALWSAVETILPPRKDGANITHYIDQITPALMIGYSKGTISTLLSDFRNTFADQFLELIRPKNTGENILIRFSKILLLEDFIDDKEKLLDMAAKHPLAVYKIHKTQKELRNPKSVREYNKLHEKKIKWQIERIYRARNDIIHAGKVPESINLLVSNLHEYYDSIMFNFSHYLHLSDTNASIENIFTVMRIDFEFYDRCLVDFCKTNRLNEENLPAVLGIF